MSASDNGIVERQYLIHGIEAGGAVPIDICIVIAVDVSGTEPQIIVGGRVRLDDYTGGQIGHIGIDDAARYRQEQRVIGYDARTVECEHIADEGGI